MKMKLSFKFADGLKQILIETAELHDEEAIDALFEATDLVIFIKIIYKNKN
jgi:hypothetical protein